MKILLRQVIPPWHASLSACAVPLLLLLLQNSMPQGMLTCTLHSKSKTSPYKLVKVYFGMQVGLAVIVMQSHQMTQPQLEHVKQQHQMC
jgi:hypothetical protein